MSLIGQRIKEERGRLRLSQPAFGEIAGATKWTVINWEKGESAPDAMQLAALGAAGMDVTYVVTGVRGGASDPQSMELQDPRYISFGARFANARVVAGLSLQDVASACGVNTLAVESWERGEAAPDVVQLRALRDEGLDVAFLFGDALEEPQQLNRVERELLAGFRLLKESGQKAVRQMISALRSDGE